MRFRLYRENGALNSAPIFDAFSKGVSALGHEIVHDREDVAVIWSVLWFGRMTANKAVYEAARKLNRPVIIIEVGSLIRGQTWKISVNHINALGEFGNTVDLDQDRPQKLKVNLLFLKAF
jgi:hypothetical protein